MRRRNRTEGQGSGGGSAARARIAVGAALDQVQPQQLAADGGSDVRCLAGARDARVLGPGRARGRGFSAREAQPELSSVVSVLTCSRPSPDSARAPPALHEATSGLIRTVAWIERSVIQELQGPGFHCVHPSYMA